MGGPLQDVRVVEIGLWLAGPACATILADWGAEVIKIEPHTGDPFRGYAWNFGGTMNPPFELDNRGKRSVALDLASPIGREIVLELLTRADVLVTNYRTAGLERLGLGWEQVHDLNPRLVYASITGYGLEGPERDRASYDMGAYWARAGVAAALTLPGADIPYQRGGMGDHMTGVAAAGGIAAALFERHRTGEGRLVSTSLLRTGMYQLSTDLNSSLRAGTKTIATSVRRAVNPLLTGYRCADDAWIWLLLLEGDRHWPNLARAIERPDLEADARFATMEGRRDNAADVCAELGRIFATRSREQWAYVLDREGVWWARVQHVHELIDDPQAHAAGGFVEVPLADGSTATMVASPVDFDGLSHFATESIPELGQHTERVLLELGWEWDRIATAQAAGAIP